MALQSLKGIENGRWEIRWIISMLARWFFLSSVNIVRLFVMSTSDHVDIYESLLNIYIKLFLD